MRIIFHIDMDAFFAAVEERDKPWLRGKPVVVGADPKGGKGRGVVSTANYKAREYGIHSALPISQAWRLSEKAAREGKPRAYFLGGDFGNYAKVSEEIMAILRKRGDKIEPASIDEAYLEVKIPKHKLQITNDEWKHAEHLARQIKKEVFQKEKLTASIGVGPNKLIAKMASGMNKPDGLTIVRPDDVQKFLDPQPVEAIPGIGPKSGRHLQNKGIKTIADLRKISKRQLAEWFGKWGEDMYEKAHGIDESPVVEEYETKSIGEQETFEKDTLDPGFLIKILQGLCRSVFESVRKEKFVFKTVSIMVRFADFETKSRAHTVKKVIRDHKTFEAEVLKLFLPFLDKRENPKKKLIRLIGVRAEHLQRQGELF
ncbi:MAG: DNA polymerase IV [Candidatus Sungiibacteriota bacterium]